MSNNIGKWAGLATRLVPIIVSAVGRIKADKDALSGPDKKAAAMDLVGLTVETLEGAIGRDVLNDAAVQVALSHTIDAIVSLNNAVTAAKLLRVR